ncbi:MAG TPA: ABC transporter permease [Vicinamibacterales bacterium]
MSALARAWARLSARFRRDALDREFDAEAQSHLDLATDDYVRRGMSEVDARRLARLTFGAVEAAKDTQRDARGFAWLDALVYDVRFTLRSLSRDRRFTLAAIGMLALAIGLNVTVFTIVDAMLFRGFPLVKRSVQLLFLQETTPTGGCCLSYADFEEWQAEAHAFEGLAFVGSAGIALRDGNGRPIDLRATTVSANTFGLLGVSPLLGRDFTSTDAIPGAAPVAILNHRLWVSRFGKRPDIVGLTVHINGAPATIVGVMPERFDFAIPIEDDLWLPLVVTSEMHRRDFTGARGFGAVGRLRDGASLQSARVELETINRRLEQAYPATNHQLVPRIATHSEFNSGRDAATIWGSLWAAAWFVLLIACANVANLTLVRTMGRWREFATRIALGAGLARMVRQIFMESLALAAVAGMLGWWITTWSVRTWIAVTASRYQVLDYTVDAGTIAYLVAISVAAAVVCSLAPISRITQLGVNGALKGDARGVTQGLRGKRMAATLVAGQMALAMMLLAGTGVLVRSFLTIVGAPTGVRDPEHILVGSMRLPSDKYPDGATRLQYLDQAQTALKNTAGVEHESIASTIPVKYGGASRAFEIEGRPTSPDGEGPVGFLRTGSGYFGVVGAAPTSGRDFNDGDRATTVPVAIVNESFVVKFLAGQSPIGMRLREVNRTTPADWRTIVGVAPNVLQNDALRQQFKPLVYIPFQQEAPAARSFFLARTSAPPEQIIEAVRTAIQAVDPDVTLEEFATMKDSFAFARDFMDAEHSELGKHAKVAPVFAVIALLLAAVGLYAVIAYSVSQRTKEIGVRIAIGAASRDIRRLVLREGMRPVALGLIAGFTASLAVNRLLQSQLVGVSPDDPLTLATAPALLIVIALLACQAPCRHALQIDPAVALRHD